MPKQKVHTKSKFYFSRQPAFPQLYYVGYIGVIFSIVQAFSGNFPQSGVFLVISIIILLLRPWMLLDLNKKKLIDFFAFLPYSSEKIQNINRVILTENAVNQTLNSRGSTSTISFDQCKIHLDTGEELIQLQASKNKTSSLKKAQAIANAAKVSLEDRTS